MIWISLRWRLLLLVLLTLLASLLLSNLGAAWVIENRFSYYLASAQASASPDNEALFLSSVSHTLLLQMLLAACISSSLILLLAGRVLKPLEALREAAQKIAEGDFRQHVRVTSRDEIGQLAQAFNLMVDNLAKNEGLRKQLSSDVAHELRSPITNIRGYLEAFQDGLAQPNPELIAILYRETLFLNRLIDDLQELALAEAGQLRLDCHNLEITALAQIMLETFEGQAKERGITLIPAIPPKLPPVFADAARTEQVLRNLIKNALLHTPEGGSITLSIKQESTMLHIAIADTGSGIDAAHLPYVFERFYRADASRSRLTGGSGLGLTIVKSIVEAHGGKVFVESQLNQGTRLSFSLPLA